MKQPHKSLRLCLSLLAALSLALSTTATPAASASTGSGSFTFYGSGFGHGIGMSQWGAYGLALDGWSHAQILTHFYTGAKIQTVTLPSFIRVGLVQNVQVYHLQAVQGPVQLRTGGPSGTVAGAIPAGATWTVRVGDGRYRVLDAKGNLVGGHEWGGPKINLYATYSNGAMVKIAESNGYTYDHGYIEFNIYGTANEGRLIAVLPPQDYLYGIGEVPSSWPMQALQTQVIASRTYAFEIAQRAGQHQSWCNCAVSDDTRSQNYVGYAKEVGPDGARWVRAVDSTDGQVVAYRGAMIQAFYSASDGGYTENNENVWGGTPIPYLRGVCDPGDYTSANPMAVWQRTFTASALTSALQGSTGNIGTITGFTGVSRGVSGRVETATAVGTKGSAGISGFEIEIALGLASDRVWVNSDRNVTGPIRSRYDATMCKPGLPASPDTPVAGGERQGFANGTIYNLSSVGAHWIFGALLKFYVTHGGAAGSLGFPTADEQTGVNGRTWATFQHGKIACTSGGVCSIV
jgi:SpoIID/LytB domain protein